MQADGMRSQEPKALYFFMPRCECQAGNRTDASIVCAAPIGGPVWLCGV